MTTVAGVSSEPYNPAAYQLGAASPTASAPPPSTQDSDHDGNRDSPYRIDVKA